MIKYLKIARVLTEVYGERKRQIRLWGDQQFPMHHRDDPNGFAMLMRGVDHSSMAEGLKALGKQLGPDDSGDRILLEEVFEACAETDPAAMREELVQVAAVAVKMIELIDQGAGR